MNFSLQVHEAPATGRNVGPCAGCVLNLPVARMVDQSAPYPSYIRRIAAIAASQGRLKLLSVPVRSGATTEPIAPAVSAKGAGGSILCPRSVRVSKTNLNRVRQGFVIQGFRGRWKRRCILHSRKGHFVERSTVA